MSICSLEHYTCRSLFDTWILLLITHQPWWNNTAGSATQSQYYAQVQGQMAIGDRPWCDFVVYTTKGIHVQRIPFDRRYWEKVLLSKLIKFYDNCLGPEIVSPVHVLGLPIRNLSTWNSRVLKTRTQYYAIFYMFTLNSYFSFTLLFWPFCHSANAR